jgi:hypothetical protein
MNPYLVGVLFTLGAEFVGLVFWVVWGLYKIQRDIDQHNEGRRIALEREARQLAIEVERELKIASEMELKGTLKKAEQERASRN